MIAAAKELEPGARAMLLLADGLFRLDVVINGDTLRTVVRNLSRAELSLQSGPDGIVIGGGNAAAYEPARSSIVVTLGESRDRVRASIVIATMQMADRGTVRVSAQAIVRHESA